MCQKSASLRDTPKPIRPSAPQAAIKVISGIRPKTVPSIGAHALSLLVRFGNLVFQLLGALVDQLQL
jgi:hypothetical protein